MRFYFLLFVMMLSGVAASAQDTLWTRSHGGAYDDFFRNIIQTSDGNFAATGGLGTAAGDDDVWLVKLDSDGDTIWTKAFGGPNRALGWYLQETADGGFVIVGDSDQYQWAGYVIKTDSVGNLEWKRNFEELKFRYVHQMPWGGYIVAGYSWNYPKIDGFLLKLDSAGDIDYPHYPYMIEFPYVRVYSFYPLPNGDLIACGWYDETSSGAGGDMWLCRLDSALDIQWMRTYGDPDPDSVQGAWSMCLTQDGGFVMAGFDAARWDIGKMGDVYLIRTDADGDTVWTRTYGYEMNEQAWCIQPTPDGGFVVSGVIDSDETDWGGDAWLLRLGANGDTLWTHRFDYQPGTNSNEHLLGVTVLSNSEFLACGYHGTNMIDSWQGLLARYGAGGGCCNHDGIRGDINYDLQGPNIVDLTYLVMYLFDEGSEPPCREEGDVNADTLVNIVDLTNLVAHLFGGGEAPQLCP